MSYYKIRPRSGTATQWATANPILAEREIGYEVPATGFGTGPVRLKMGDGVTPWNNLPYADPEQETGDNYLTKDDIVNNAETNDPNKVASASALYNVKKDLDDSLQLINSAYNLGEITAKGNSNGIQIDLSTYSFLYVIANMSGSDFRLPLIPIDTLEKDTSNIFFLYQASSHNANLQITYSSENVLFLKEINSTGWTFSKLKCYGIN